MDYSAGRLMAGIIGAFGWLCIGVAAFIVMAGLLDGPDVMASLIIAAPVALAGFLIVMMAQLVKAQFATAEGVWQLVELTKAAKAQDARPSGVPGGSGLSSAAPSESARDFVEVYRHTSIYRSAKGFSALNRDFPDVMSARAGIDEHFAGR